MAKGLGIQLAGYATTIRNYLASSSCLAAWPECRQLLVDYADREQDQELALPILSCLAVSGHAETAIPVSAAWFALRLASHLLDDLADDKDHRLDARSSNQMLVQFSPGLIFSAFLFIEEAYEPSISQQIMHVFSEAGIKSNYGYFDLLNEDLQQLPIDQALEVYWKDTILKSGSIYRAGMACGAIAGSGSDESVKALSDYGMALGVILQILDDCRDYFSDDRQSLQEISLPVLLYSLSAGAPQKTDYRLSVPKGESREQILGNLQARKVPEMVSELMDTWLVRARESLDGLEPNEAVQSLKDLLELFAKV